MGESGIVDDLIVAVCHLLDLANQRRLSDASLAVNCDHAFGSVQRIHAILNKIGATHKALRIAYDAGSEACFRINELEHHPPAIAVTATVSCA